MLKDMETLLLAAATCVIMLLVAVALLLRAKWRHSPQPGHVR